MSNPIVNLHSSGRACLTLHNRIEGISYPHSGGSYPNSTLVDLNYAIPHKITCARTVVVNFMPCCCCAVVIALDLSVYGLRRAPKGLDYHIPKVHRHSSSRAASNRQETKKKKKKKLPWIFLKICVSRCYPAHNLNLIYDTQQSI